jgi:hypothetical protein
LDEPLRQTLTVGRPIDEAACVKMPEDHPNTGRAGT